MAITAKKIFLYSDQEKFAALSGDFNPVHLDRVLARREIFGDIVVHGIHLLLKALDIFVAQSGIKQKIALSFLRTKFFSPVFVNREFVFIISSESGHLNVEVRDNKALLISIMDIDYQENRYSFDEENIPTKIFQSTAPDSYSDSIALKEMAGEAELCLDEHICNELMPDLLKKISKTQVSELLSLTRIVGMKCPGMQSLFSGLDLTYAIKEMKVLKYKVSQVIEKFSMINLRVDGPSLTGTLATMFRPMAVQQPSIKEIAADIIPGTFTGLTSLIIGGSRGIGETTAKIIAAGGGKPTITYHMGKEEAERVCNEIRSAGFECNCLQMDIDNLNQGLHMVSDIKEMNSVFYFATPKILRSNVFDSELFKNFSHYYVAQFDRLIRLVKSYTQQKVIFFYPSTVAIDEKTPGLKEYIMAKSAGEYLCESLNKELTDAHIYSIRLPRLLTDQTMNLQNYPAKSIISIMNPIIQNMREWIFANNK